MPEIRKNMQPVLLNSDSVRERLAELGWRPQGLESHCANEKETINVTWWNHGSNSLMLVDQKNVGAMLYAPAISRQSAATLIRTGAVVKKDLPPLL